MTPELLDPQTMLPVGAVVWGPFPLRRARLCGGLGTLGLALVMILVGLQRQRVSCARSGALAEQCEWQSGITGRTVRRFPLRSLQAVRVDYSETSNKGHTTRWGQLVLRLSERELALARQPAESADGSAAALQTFLRDPAREQVRIETRLSVETLALGGASALAALAMLYSVWSGRRRFHFTWEPSAQQLSLQQQWPLGVMAGALSTFFLREPVEVEIKWEQVTGFFTSARSPGPRGGRLVVRLADRSTVELLPYPMPGYRVHLGAAAQLRRLLRCPPQSAAEAARLAPSYEAERPRLGPGWTGLGGRISATWLGVCCGSILGIAAGGVLALLFGFAKASDNAGGPWFYGGTLGGAAAGVALAWRLLLHPDER